jgi:hypothetical protein
MRLIIKVKRKPVKLAIDSEVLPILASGNYG